MTDDRDQNPYQSPAHVIVETVGLNRSSRELLRRVAQCQRVLILGLITQFLGIAGIVVAYVLFRGESRDFEILLIAIWSAIACAILAGSLAATYIALETYPLLPGFVFVLFSLLPMLGIMALYCINKRATNLLQQNGIRVGEFGANLNEI